MNLSTYQVTTVAGRVGVVGYADGQRSVGLFDVPLGITMDAAGSFALIVRQFMGPLSSTFECAPSSCKVTPVIFVGGLL